MVIPTHVDIDGQPHRLAHFAKGKYTTGTGAPSGPIDGSTRPVSLIQLVNTDAANTCYVGADASVTKDTGVPLGPGAAMKIASNDPSERVVLNEVFIAGDGTHAIVVAFWTV